MAGVTVDSEIVWHPFSRTQILAAWRKATDGGIIHSRLDRLDAVPRNSSSNAMIAYPWNGQKYCLYQRMKYVHLHKGSKEESSIGERRIGKNADSFAIDT